jgi:flagellar biosynthesis GTPase FlhF
MKNIYTIALASLLMVATGCGSHKGSSSLGSGKRVSTTASSPRVKSGDSQSASSATSMSAAKEAERAAKAEAEKAKKAAKDAEAKAAKEAAKAAKKAQKDAEHAAAKAKAEAEKRAKDLEKESIVVKEEKVTVVEKGGSYEDNSRYHIIIGSFKVLDNARQLCQEAMRNNFLPSIMENEDGLYRVSVYSSSVEKTVRNKVAEIRQKYPEYVGTWLLIEKK